MSARHLLIMFVAVVIGAAILYALGPGWLGMGAR
jgi:hypothetical protein